MRGGSDEALSPKYAHIERERRWLVKHDARSSLLALSPTLIEDRYIDGTRMRLRRMTNEATGDQSLKLTKKYDAADVLARPIVTSYLTDTEYQVMLALPAKPLSKHRFHVEDAGREFSVDVFLGPLTGLELVEIEWDDDQELRALTPPSWAGREVSDDFQFQGGWLAANGLPGN